MLLISPRNMTVVGGRVIRATAAPTIGAIGAIGAIGLRRIGDGEPAPLPRPYHGPPGAPAGIIPEGKSVVGAPLPLLADPGPG
jgi:hypothetical protein